jgi:hypothetical protein
MSAELDREIDRAVREMLDVEPSAGLRARVMQRIDEGHAASGFSRKVTVASAFRRKILWVAMPVAAAAVILIAVVLARRDGAAPPPTPTAGPTIAKATPTSEPPTSTQSAPAGTPRTATTADRRRLDVPPRGAQRVTATAAVESAPADGFPRVPSLSVPALTLSEIRGVAPAEPARIGVDPIAAPAPLEIEPLPLSPRERQNQE